MLPRSPHARSEEGAPRRGYPLPRAPVAQWIEQRVSRPGGRSRLAGQVARGVWRLISGGWQAVAAFGSHSARFLVASSTKCLKGRRLVPPRQPGRPLGSLEVGVALEEERRGGCGGERALLLDRRPHLTGGSGGERGRRGAAL